MSVQRVSIISFYVCKCKSGISVSYSELNLGLNQEPVFFRRRASVLQQNLNNSIPCTEMRKDE